MEYRAVTKDDAELKHYGVLGMKWGVHKSNHYEKSANRHAKKAESLQKKADDKRNSFMNTPNRKIKYAIKEQRYANAEKFHNQKAMGLSYGNKLFGKTLDYKVNKNRAASDRIMREKYSLAKTGLTNRVNRLEYRARKQLIKADSALLKKKITDLKLDNKGKEAIDAVLNSALGKSLIQDTWSTRSSINDNQSLGFDYPSNRQVGR